MNTLRNVSILLGDAQGLRSKAAVCRYLLRGVRRRFDTASMADHDSHRQEFFARFKYAALWFESSELTPYLEIFHNRVYDFDFDIQPGEIVFDIGANIGLFSICQARRREVERVYAFEPDPRAYNRLLRNLAANRANGVVPIGKAVSSVEGQFHLKLNRRTISSGLHDQQADTVPIHTVSLDAFAAASGIPRVGLLKIDVEGAELEVLRGGATLLNVTRQIALECHSEALRDEARIFLRDRDFVEVGERYLDEYPILGFKKRSAPVRTVRSN